LRLRRRPGKLDAVSDFSRLLERIDAQRRRAAAADPAAPCAPEDLEDLLTEGYLAALTDESRSRRLADRLEGLARTIDDEQAAIEARRLAIEKRTVDQRVSVLRRHLTDLREEQVRLRRFAPRQADGSRPS
jgi:hypothetical protein